MAERITTKDIQPLMEAMDATISEFARTMNISVQTVYIWLKDETSMRIHPHNIEKLKRLKGRYLK